MLSRWWHLLGTLTLSAIVGCGVDSGAEEGSEAEIEAVVTVKAVPVKLDRLIDSVDALGRCEALPDHIAILTPAVQGHVHALQVVQGERVTKGQPIVELDKSVAEATLAEKVAARDGLQDSLALLKSLPRPEERKANEVAVDQARVAVEQAQATLQRLESLRENYLASEQQLYDARKLLETAQLQQDTAEATLRAMMIGPRQEAVDEARGRIKTAEALVAFARAELDFHTISAPIDGVLDSLVCHPGESVAIGTPVGQVVNTGQIFATVWLTSSTASMVQAGQPATVWPADRPGSASEDFEDQGQGMPGKVAFIGRVADAQTGGLPVRVLVENPRGVLSIGQSVRLRITVDVAEKVLQVPGVAVVDLGEGPILNVVREGKSVTLHPTVGPPRGDWVPVSGTDLKPGELVIVEGGYNLPEGTTVKLAHTDQALAHAGASQ